VISYISKVLYILADAKKTIIPLIILFTVASVIETVGVGLIGPFLNLSSHPEAIKNIAFLNWVYTQLDIQSTKKFIFLLGLVIAAIFTLKSVLYFFVRISVFTFSFQQKKVIIGKLLHTYLSVPYTFHLNRNTSSLIKNVILETEHFTHYCLIPLLMSVANLTVTIVLLGLLAQTDILLLSLMLGTLLPIFLVFQKLSKKFSLWGEVLSQTYQEMVRIINHSLGGVKETRVIGCEAYFEEQMEKEAQKHCQAATLYYSYESLPRILIETVLIIFIVLFISISQIVSGDNSQDFISVLGVFAVGSIRLIPSASQFVQALAQMRSHSYTLEMLYLDLKEIEQLKPQQMSLKAKTKLLNPAYQRSQTMKFFNKVELSNITYTYPGTSEPSIQGISLNLEKGKSIALIGKSGAGKTTLVDVILGLLEPQYGDIKVDDLSIYNTIRGWQNLIGYIPQSISLIDDTIKRNIAFGVPDIFMNHDSLHKAIEAAQLGELISQLPDGLQTQVGERGIRLSGGQRQRIGIARALYFQREILVLDEATSALDNETESLVTEAIRNLSGTKTMIIIAHRLTTVKHCDEIYMLEKGRIIKSGTYEEVVSSQKIYS